MSKYRVIGHTTIKVVVEVEARSEEEAYEEARNKLPALSHYGRAERLVGVDDEGDSISADEEIKYDDIEFDYDDTGLSDINEKDEGSSPVIVGRHINGVTLNSYE